ncbi:MULTISPECIES: hypothetical protein [unclassified Arthrobacter]|uniref:hypothetical protein n=1 Tax=unclassified Arthrobacter TaxID=235627 RepID=UPI000CE4E3F5|nr:MULTISPECIES: hypothetical protein [unclassified Arthrobacter]
MTDDQMKKWLQDGDSPQLQPGRDLSEVPLQRLRFAFTRASAFYASQVAWFQEYIPDIRHVSKSGGTIHEFSLTVQPPVEEWALLAGEILNQLSSARDNLFKDVVKRASDGEEGITKNLKGGAHHWPSYFDERQWEPFVRRYHFIPEVILDRIKSFQPFLDLHPDGGTTDREWMKAGASTWARQLNNHDKHDEPMRVAAHHYLGSGVTALSEITLRGEVQQRWDHTDPHSSEPLISIHCEPVDDLRLTVPTIDIVLMSMGPSELKWDPLNSGLWSALWESQCVINTVYYGRERARELSIPFMEYASRESWTDFRYVLKPGGGYDLLIRGNYAQEALKQCFV